MFLRIFHPSAAIHDVATDVPWDASRLRVEIQKRVRLLADLGFGDGDRAVIAHGNSAWFFADLLAVWTRGGAAIPLDSKVGELELANIVSQSGARAVIYQGRPGKGVAADFSAQGLATYDTLETDALLPEDLGPDWKDPRPDDLALILYTSGTTEEPKGVAHTFRTLSARLRSLEPYIDGRLLKRTACLLPTNFGHGLICNCLYPLYSGATLYIFPSHDLRILAGLGSAIDQHGITFLSSVPAMWKILGRGAEPPRKGSLKLIHCGSAPLGAALWEGIREWSGIQSVRNLYGITEVGSWTAGSPDPAVPAADGFIGPGWGAEIAVLPEEARDSGTNGSRRVRPGEVGEVWVRTPALMQGYYNRPDLYAAVVKDGWFRTGDLGFLDERTCLTLVGRTSHAINLAGMKVYPEDVDILLERHPEVSQACTFAADDPVAGQAVAAAISPATPGAAIDLSRLSDWCRKRVSDYKVPTRWFVLDAIPTNERGKLHRDSVKEACLKGQSGFPI
ncbi:MAG: class I adenylate-forming enzyme family protein [Nitrospinota bacterium]